MTAFTPDQWLILILVFLLGLLLGMYFLAGGKWKRRYRDEVRLRDDDRRQRETLEAENERLVAENRQIDTLRGAAAKDEARRRDDLDDRPGLINRPPP